jgi:carbonic anhydrase
MTSDLKKKIYYKICRSNVIEQVCDLAKASIVQSAWKSGLELTLHGWVYGLNSGFVTDLGVNFSSDKDLDQVYQLQF